MSDKDLIYEIVNDVLPKGEKYQKYRRIKPFSEGGTRKVYEATFGPNEEPVVIKADKVPISPRAKRHVERGCNTEHELQNVGKIRSPDKHNLIRLRDWYYSQKLEALGYSGIMTVEDKFDGENLEEVVKEEPLNGLEFGQVFRDVLEAERYLIKDCGIYHRDLSKKNILVRRNGRLKAKVADLANACDVDSVNPKSMPTAGSVFNLDPTTFETFCGNTSYYREEAEIHAVGKNMLYALTGEEPIHYDPENGTAVDSETRKSLMKSEGRLDFDKHRETIRRSLKRIKGSARRYVPVIERALSLDEEQRYHDLNDLIKDFNEASRATLWEKIKAKKNSLMVWGIGALGVIGIGALILTGLLNRQRSLEESLAFEQETLRVGTRYNPERITFTNNYADLRFDLSRKGDWKTGTFTDQSKFIPIKPGEEYWGFIKSDEHVIPCKTGGIVGPTLAGKAYIEGREGKEFFINADPITPYFPEGMGRGQVGHTYFNLNIPEDLKEGVYTLAVEFYAPENKAPKNRNSSEKFEFNSPKKILARKRIPLVVGDPKDYAWLDAFYMNGYSARFNFHRPDSSLGNLNRSLEYEASIPEEGISWKLKDKQWATNLYSEDPDLPSEGTDTTTKTLQIIARNPEGEIVGINYTPVERWNISQDSSLPFWWRPSLPDAKWSENLIAYRQAVEGDSTALKAMWAVRDSIRQKVFADSLEQAQLDSLIHARELEYWKSGASSGNLGISYFNNFVKPKIIDSVKVAREKDIKISPQRWRYKGN